VVEEKGGRRLIAGINDIDVQVRQEAEYRKRLSQAQARAAVDALTGVKNRHSYLEAEKKINRLIAEKNQPPFALAILDVNDLKKINDTAGHQAGDDCLRQACRIICKTFKHSPVFRIGGDEFAVLSQGEDYERIGELTALIEAQARRLGLENVRPMVRDALKAREDLIQTMDGVLLDAPCTGLGMLAEKPDIKLRVTEESLRELTEIQRKMLDTVCAYVREGGTLVYSTCSILPEENEQQAEDFLRRHPEFEAAALPETVPEKYTQYRKTGLQLLEYRDGVEGFYVCRFRRKRI
jgi:diguanylate cyclase (GGDEF)-like protein